MLKRTIYLIAVLILLPGLTSSVFGEMFVSTSFRYDTASDDNTPEMSGHEITIPFGLGYKGEQVSLSVESAYSQAFVVPGNEPDAKLAGFTDTLVSLTYTHAFSTQPMAFTLGLNVNLPTGKEHLNETETIAEWGESNDLFEVDNFGEGLNVSVSLGLMRQFNDLTVAIHGAYIYNSEYDPTRDIPDDSLDPGEQFFAVGMLDWKAASWLQLNLYSSYAYFGIDKTEGKESFRQGQQVVIGSNVNMGRKPLFVFFGLQSTLPGKNEILIDNALEKEAENSNGRDIFVLLACTYQFPKGLNIRLQGDIRYYGESPLIDSQTGKPFSGKRLRYAVGPGFTYAINPHLSLNGLMKVFALEQRQDVFAKRDVTFQGINFDFGVRYTL